MFWCKKCKQVGEQVSALYGATSRDDFAVLAVLYEDVDGGEMDQEEAAEYRDVLELPFPVLFDADRAVTSQYDWFDGIPQLYLIDRDGVVAWRQSGGPEETGELIRAQLERVLGESAGE